MADDYPWRPVPFTDVSLGEGFWRSRIETNRTATVPYCFRRCEETGRIDNFSKAAGEMEGEHSGIRFNDSDVSKVIEGAAYALAIAPDPQLEAYVDSIIRKMSAAQEGDGYLFTIRTASPKKEDPAMGKERWSLLSQSHELYNLGHMYEAAVAYYQATGKRELLDVSLKSAELLLETFGPDKRHDIPGHQEIEIGLAKLYRVTDDRRLLKLARFFLEERGRHQDRELYGRDGMPGYNQDHAPVAKQSQAVGHAVRAGYMYAGMADVAALSGEKTYLTALDRIWHDVVSSKLYLTGGIGARHEGEAFGEPFELPNRTAYNETCAAIANILWNHRMFLLHGDARYYDVLERSLYNGFVAGVGLDGQTFFYPNPLESDGVWKFNKGAAERQSWFDCSCCPTNVVRFLPSIPGLIYGVRDTTLSVNLFVPGEATVAIAGTTVRIVQDTNYPWNGHVILRIEPSESVDMTLRVRLPGWVIGHPVPGSLYRYGDSQTEKLTIEVAGQSVRPVGEDFWIEIAREWAAGDTVELDLPMPVRTVVCDDRVEGNRGRVAFERGPIVYCFEEADNGGGLLDRVVPADIKWEERYQPDLLGGVITLQGAGLTAVPYYAWCHRGAGEMAVWMIVDGE